ncbi:MAG: ATP-binding protein [Deltaproteobacteria bacterium]|nr:ATP-binding protein [Deltaproteobacteria bacterium]
MLIVPVVVGLVFGLVLRRVVRFREEERALREALDTIHRELESRFEARTRQLQQKEAELFQAQKMEAIGQLAGGVAHDFNNILTSILGGASLLEEQLPEDQADARAILVDIQDASERAARLTKQLLTLSRKQILDPSVLLLGDVAEAMLPMLRRILPEDISIHLDLVDECAPIWADRSQVEQVILNLCVNARDALPSGGEIRLTVGLALREDWPEALEPIDEGYCLLTVSDDGLGMSEETRSRIFEPFFTTKTDRKGSGLGLSLVQGIVERAGGLVTVTSQAGEGCTFRVFLPRTTREAEAAAPPRPPAAPRTDTLTVLLIEDNAAVRGLVHRVLEVRGFRLLEATDGEEGIALARGHEGKIDLVLSDVIMPGVHGPEAAEEILALHPEARVLFMTGYPGEEIEGRMGRPLAPSTLAKPFSVQELLAAIEATLEGKG